MASHHKLDSALTSLCRRRSSPLASRMMAGPPQHPSPPPPLLSLQSSPLSSPPPPLCPLPPFAELSLSSPLTTGLTPSQTLSVLPKHLNILWLTCCWLAVVSQCDEMLLLCSDSRNDVPPVPQRNVSIAAERGAVRPSTVKVRKSFYRPSFLL